MAVILNLYDFWYIYQMNKYNIKDRLNLDLQIERLCLNLHIM